MEQSTKSQPHKCKQIIRECFWEYNMTIPDILEMAEKGSGREKNFLFSTIMENATDVLQSLRIFSIADQKKMILQYKAPRFNHHFLDKRHKVVKYLLTGQKVDIPELRWNI